MSTVTYCGVRSLHRRLCVFLLATTLLLLVTQTGLRADTSTADLQDRVAKLCEEGRFAEARDGARQLLELRRANQASKRYEIQDAERLVESISFVLSLAASGQQEIATAWQLKARAAEGLKQSAGAQVDSLANRRLEILKKYFPADDLSIADCYTDLARARLIQTDPAVGERFVRDALAIYRKRLGDEHPDVLGAMTILSRSLLVQMKIAEAEALARESVALAEKFPEDPAKLLSALRILGGALIESGKYSDAESYMRQALDLARQTHDDRLVASAAADLAFHFDDVGNAAEAEPLWTEALSAGRRYYGERHPTVARYLQGMADNQLGAGKYARGEALAREALTIMTETQGVETASGAYTLHTLARARQLQGDLVAAEPLYRRSLAVKQKVLGPEHPHVAFALDGLAFLAILQGDYAHAESLYREALEILRKYYGDDHPDVARLKAGLAWALASQGKYRDALLLERQVIESRRKTLGAENTMTVNAIGDLAGMLSNSGKNYAEADSLYRWTLKIDEKKYPEDHWVVALTCFNLGDVNVELENYDAAAHFFRQALDKQRSGTQDRNLLNTLVYLGRLRLLQGETGEAESLLREAAEIYDPLRIRAGVGMARAAVRSPYPDLAALSIQTGRETEAWADAEKNLARSLTDLLQTADARSLSPKEAAAEDSLAREMGELEDQWATLQDAGAVDSTGETGQKVMETRIRLSQAQERWAALQRSLAEKYPVAEGEIYSLERVRHSLDRRTAITGWLDVETGLGHERAYQRWTYLIRSRGPVVWRRADLDSASAAQDPAVEQEQFRDALLSPSALALGVDSRARRLYQVRIAPVEDFLHGVHNLIVIPSGAMLGVPVEALIDREGNLFGDRFAITYAPSVTVYAWLQERSRDNSGRRAKTALLVGDPPFNEEQEVAMGSGPSEAAKPGLVRLMEVASTRSALAGNSTALAQLPRLRGTREEVEAIEAVCGGATVLVGPDASEQKLMQLARADGLRSFDVIHIATHALVDNAQPDQSALILSQVGLPDRYEAAVAGERVYRGLVTARDIVRDWKLDADLVTLSACETALGREVPGEGYVGFLHAFLQAGAHSLLLSLWKVDDHATSLLMQRFYENYFGFRRDGRDVQRRKPMTKAAALREAKAWLRAYEDAAGARPYAHPGFWSAFVLVGTSR